MTLRGTPIGTQDPFWAGARTGLRDQELLGVEYINEYLRRLLMEFDLLGRSELAACQRVLERSSPDSIGLVVNLYEPIVTNAIGRALIGRDPVPLLIAADERAETAATLQPLPEADKGAASREVALRSGDLRGVFV